MMDNSKGKSLWFLTGSQHLYGKETLDKVASNATGVAGAIGGGLERLAAVVTKPLLTTSEDILQTCLEANNDPQCIGVICWMHTFSPAQMWIAGLECIAETAVAPPHPA
jgi:L-arabinose isomerase